MVDTMTFSIVKQTEFITVPVFDTARFRHVLEDHMSVLRSDPATELSPIDGTVANKFIGDFYGLLQSMNIKYEYRWVTMRINGFKTPYEYDGTILNILLPPMATLNTIIGRYMTTRN